MTAFQVYEHCPGHAPARARAHLTEGGAEGILSSHSTQLYHLASGHQVGCCVSKAVALPAGIAHPDSSLANVDGDVLRL